MATHEQVMTLLQELNGRLSKFWSETDRLAERVCGQASPTGVSDNATDTRPVGGALDELHVEVTRAHKMLSDIEVQVSRVGSLFFPQTANAGPAMIERDVPLDYATRKNRW